MTTGAASSILGGGGVPVGGLANFWGVGLNPTINGVEYLRSGVMKAISGYSALLTAAPGLCYNVTTATNTNAGINNATTMRHAGSGYYVFCSSGTQPYYATSLTATGAATTVDTDVTVNDAFAFNTHLMHVTNTAATFYRITAGAGTSIAVLAGATYISGAVNAAGTLGLIACDTAAVAGNIYTSTNGTAWTSRTPSGGSGDLPYFTVWQPLTSTFAILSSSARIYTTADGFALTNQGVTASYTTVSPVGSYSGSVAAAASSYCAADSTATLFSCTANFGGAASRLTLMRSTNGTTFTGSLWSTLLGFTPTVLPKISVQGGVFIAYFPGVTTRLNDASTASAFQSADGGATWTPLPIPMNTAQGLSATITEFRYMNSLWTVMPTAQQSNPPFTVSSLSATHVGMPIAQTQTNAALVITTSYARIK